MKKEELEMSAHYGLPDTTSFKLTKEDNEFLDKEAAELNKDGITKGAKGMVLRQIVRNARKAKKSLVGQTFVVEKTGAIVSVEGEDEDGLLCRDKYGEAYCFTENDFQ